jgi:CarD family transcriptional regulator
MVKSTKSSSKSKPKSKVKLKIRKRDKVKIKGLAKSPSKSRPSAKVTTEGVIKSTSKSQLKKKSKIKPKEIGAAKDTIRGTAKALPKGSAKSGFNETLEKKKKLLFSPGDYVVYPTHGVGQVTNVEIKEIAGHKLKLFVISFDEDRMTLRVPVTKVTTSGLRKLTSRKKMDDALETLKGRARVKRTMWSRRAQEYEAKINSGDPLAIAEVVRDLHRKSGQPEQSFSERQIFESACHRLAMELAAIEKIDIEAATERMEDLLKAA